MSSFSRWANIEVSEKVAITYFIRLIALYISDDTFSQFVTYSWLQRENTSRFQ